MSIFIYLAILLKELGALDSHRHGLGVTEADTIMFRII